MVKETTTVGGQLKGDNYGVGELTVKPDAGAGASRRFVTLRMGAMALSKVEGKELIEAIQKAMGVERG